LKKFLLLIMAGLSIAAGPASAAESAYAWGEIYERKVLFSVRYGNALNELRIYRDQDGAVLGPTSMAVDGQGNIYIAHRPGRMIKRFSPEGKLLGCIGADAWAIAADGAGNLYVLEEHRPAGGVLSALKVAKYDPTGKLLYTLFPELFRPFVRSESDASWPLELRVDSTGNWYCIFASGRLKLSAEGKVIGTVPSDLFDGKGQFYLFEPLQAKVGGKISFRKLSPEGERIGAGAITVRKPNYGKGEHLLRSFYDEEAFAGLAVEAMDDSANIYLSGVVETRQPIVLPFEMQILGRQVIQKYSPSGRLLTEIQFMSEPYGAFPRYQISRQGEITQLNFLSDRVEVVRWTPRAPFRPAPKASPARSEPSDRE